MADLNQNAFLARSWDGQRTWPRSKQSLVPPSRWRERQGRQMDDGAGELSRADPNTASGTLNADCSDIHYYRHIKHSHEMLTAIES